MTTPHRQRLLGDEGRNAPSCWCWGSEAEPIHMVLMAYRGQRTGAQGAAGEIDARIDAARLCEVYRLKSCPFRTEKEHFGFHDGVSTLKFKDDRYVTEAPEGLEPGEFILGLPNEYGRFTPRPLVSPNDDPGRLLSDDVEGSGARDFGRNGTYLVFRQLQQHVYTFWSFMRDAARQVYGVDGGDRYIDLAAKMVGRWPSGASLVHAPDRDRPDLKKVNEFAYHREDPLGLACPIGAHVRRANPRDSLDPSPGPAQVIDHQSASPAAAPWPALWAGAHWHNESSRRPQPGRRQRPRGLCFIALNANIAASFEFIQASWLNNPTFADFTTTSTRWSPAWAVMEETREACSRFPASRCAGASTASPTS
jgi:deferrochelatase/peroxidase EfeB